MLPRACVDKKPQSNSGLLWWEKHGVTPAYKYQWSVSAVQCISGAAEPCVLLFVHVWPQGISCAASKTVKSKVWICFVNTLLHCVLKSNPWFDDPVLSTATQVYKCVLSVHLCAVQVHVCVLCAREYPILKVQLLLSPVNPNFFFSFPHHSWLWLPRLPETGILNHPVTRLHHCKKTSLVPHRCFDCGDSVEGAPQSNEPPRSVGSQRCGVCGAKVTYGNREKKVGQLRV